MLKPSNTILRLKEVPVNEYFFFNGIPYVKIEIIGIDQVPLYCAIMRLHMWDQEPTETKPKSRRMRRHLIPGEQNLQMYLEIRRNTELARPEFLGKDVEVVIAEMLVAA
jgi:hypothetical protein